jgi:hypothetical protein
MLVAEEVQQSVHKRLSPVLPDHLRADDHVAELSRDSGGKLLSKVDREGEHVRGLVDAEMLLLQLASLVRGDEHDADLPLRDSLRVENTPHDVGRRLLVDGDAASVRHLDLDHLVLLQVMPPSFSVASARPAVALDRGQG